MSLYVCIDSSLPEGYQNFATPSFLVWTIPSITGIQISSLSAPSLNNAQFSLCLSMSDLDRHADNPKNPMMRYCIILILNCLLTTRLYDLVRLFIGSKSYYSTCRHKSPLLQLIVHPSSPAGLATNGQVLRSVALDHPDPNVAQSGATTNTRTGNTSGCGGTGAWVAHWAKAAAGAALTFGQAAGQPSGFTPWKPVAQPWK